MSRNVNFIGTQEEWDALVEKNKLRKSAMKKQTAVEWLVQEMINNGLLYPISEMSKKIEQAKAMEKQQIIDAHGDEQSHLQDDGSCRTVTSEQYYNETYGSKGSDDHIGDANEMVSDTYKVWECCGMEECICKGSDEPNNITYWVGVVKWNDGTILTTEPFFQYQDIKVWSSKFSYENTGKFESIDYKRIDGKSYTYSEALTNEERINNAEIIRDVASSQTEISDEEIEKWVASTPYYGHCTTEYKEGLEDGIKWYKEQLKSRV